MKLPFYPDLTEKTVVVTGGGGTLPREFCKAAAACKAKVAVLNRTLSKAEDVVKEIEAEGGKAIAVSVDVMSKESLMAAHEEVLSKLGPCDILINAAGGNNPKTTTTDEYYNKESVDDPEKLSFFDIKSEDFHQVLDLNITGVFLSTQEFVKDMVAKKSGNIINISSMNAFTPLTKIPAYSAAKSGVSNFTQWTAVHFCNAGIRCNAIAPGFFSAKQNAKLLWNEDGSPTPRTNKILSGTPMNRFGTTEELLGALLFFMDDNSSGFITGVVLPVDGGFSAYSGV